MYYNSTNLNIQSSIKLISFEMLLPTPLLNLPVSSSVHVTRNFSFDHGHVFIQCGGGSLTHDSTLLKDDLDLDQNSRIFVTIF